jgi:energy-dependent translational throttle protein EttA
MAEESRKIIFSMIGVNKMHNRKVILKDINLSFYYGAKIGVLGLNGSGKSSLLRVLAGIDKEFDGDLHFESGYTIGLLAQEPQLEAGFTVREIVMQGVAHWVSLNEEYENSWELLCRSRSAETGEDRGSPGMAAGRARPSQRMGC